MESWDQTQKINNLARELIKHKVVNSAEEAFKRAEATVKSGQKVDAPENELQKDVRQLRFAISDAAKYLKEHDEKMAKFKEELETLRIELANARSDISALKMKAKEQRIEPRIEQPKTEQSMEQKATESLQRIIKPKETVQKPIEIDKIFYFGNKNK